MDATSSPPSPIPSRLSAGVPGPVPVSTMEDSGCISVPSPIHSRSSLVDAKASPPSPSPSSPSPNAPTDTPNPHLIPNQTADPNPNPNPPSPGTGTGTRSGTGTSPTHAQGQAKQPPQPPLPPGYDSKPLKILLVLAFLATAAVSAVLPAIGPMLEDDIFDGDGKAASLFLSLVSLSSSAVEFFSNPILGAASDQYGRRPFMLLALTGAAISFTIIGAFPSKASFIVSGVLRGFTSVTGAMFYSMVVDLSKSVSVDPSHITKNTGLMIACGAVGLVVGAGVGGALSTLGNRYAFLGAAVVEVGVIVFFLFFVKESLAVSTVFQWRDHNPFTALGILCQSRSLTLLSVVFVLQALTWGVYVQAPFFTEERFDWKAPNIGAVLVWGGIIMVCTQAVGVRFLTPMYGEYRLLIVAFSAGIVHFGLMGLATHGWMWFAVIAVTFPWFLAAPALRGLMAKSVTGPTQGRLQGGVSALSTLSVSIAPLFGSLIYGVGIDESDGKEGRGDFDPIAGLVFYYGSILCTAGLAFSVFLLSHPTGARPGNRDGGARREPLWIISDTEEGAAGGGGAGGAEKPISVSVSNGGPETKVDNPGTPTTAAGTTVVDARASTPVESFSSPLSIQASDQADDGSGGGGGSDTGVGGVASVGNDSPDSADGGGVHVASSQSAAVLLPPSSTASEQQPTSSSPVDSPAT